MIIFFLHMSCPIIRLNIQRDNIQTIYKNKTDPHPAATNPRSQATNCLSVSPPNSQFLKLTAFLILASTSNLGPTGEARFAPLMTHKAPSLPCASSQFPPQFVPWTRIRD